ncbi:hypothetical protein AS27_02486, partial [Aptenodytes forsteri]
ENTYICICYIKINRGPFKKPGSMMGPGRGTGGCCPLPALLPASDGGAAARAMETLYSPYGDGASALSWVLTLTMSRRLLLWGLGVKTRGSRGIKR